MWGNLKQKMRTEQIEAHTQPNRPSEEYQNKNNFKFVDLEAPKLPKKTKTEQGNKGKEEDYHQLHKANIGNDSMPFYPAKDSSPQDSNEYHGNMNPREKVAVSTIRYELEPAPHRMLDSDADVKVLSDQERSSSDIGFAGMLPRIIVTENNTAKNTIIPKHAQQHTKEDNMDKVLRENEALRRENDRLKFATNPNQNQGN